MAYRFSLLIAGLLGAYFLLAFHLYQLQLVKGDYYLAKAQTQVAISKSTNGSRGAIYFTDKGGSVLPAAIEKQSEIIYAVPKKIEDAKEAANTVAPMLDMPVSTLIDLFSKPNDEYELLVRKAEPELAQKITELGLKGIYADFEPERFYPLNTVASHLLGYVGPDASRGGESGHYGVEGFYDEKLGGEGFADINLTIDPNVQIEAEKVLGDLLEAHGAAGGSVIVEDPATGKILAMASNPGFDPNNYSASPLADLLNPAVQKIYEPGSVFKVLTMAAGIDAGKLTPQTTYYDSGTVKVSGRTLSNYDLVKHGPYGMTTMTSVIEHSINTGAVFAEGKTGNEVFTDYLKRFGLGEKTGIDLPGELAGNLKQLTKKGAPQVAYATASYGQGVAVTPMELLNAMAAIANGGNLMRPYVNAALTPQVIRRVISTSTAEQVTAMMVSAVDKAQVATINKYSLAGKTGTAYMPDLVHGGYTDRVIDSYVGFGPASNPRFIVLIKVDNLPETALAAQIVVPAFKTLSQYLINYYNIPPNRL